MEMKGDREPSGLGASSSQSIKSGSEHSSDSNSADTEHSIDGDEGDADPPSVPKYILARKTRIEVHRRSGDRGMRVTCPTHGHGCRKFRSLEKDRELFGPSAAVYFLTVWLKAAGDMPFATHKDYKPSFCEIKAHIQTL
jgi:hypothetical protein